MLEYKAIKPKSMKQLQEELDKASNEGWKVVCSCGRKGDIIILKRNLRGED